MQMCSPLVFPIGRVAPEKAPHMMHHDVQQSLVS
jgi:hypothetical protein